MSGALPLPSDRAASPRPLQWSVALPMDVVKSRYQGAPHGTYTGFIQCFRMTLAQDGVAGLFKGAGPALLRAFPANAATFVSRPPSNPSSPLLTIVTPLFPAAVGRGVEHQGDGQALLGAKACKNLLAIRQSIDLALALSYIRIFFVCMFQRPRPAGLSPKRSTRGGGRRRHR